MRPMWARGSGFAGYCFERAFQAASASTSFPCFSSETASCPGSLCDIAGAAQLAATNASEKGSLCLRVNLNQVSKGALKKCLNQINHLIIGVHYWQQAPFVEGQARVRNVKGNHVAHTQIVFAVDTHVRVLIHHFCDDPMWRGCLWNFVPRSKMLRGSGQTRIEGCVALAHADDGSIFFRYGLNIGPDLQ